MRTGSLATTFHIPRIHSMCLLAVCRLNRLNHTQPAGKAQGTEGRKEEVNNEVTFMRTRAENEPASEC